METYYTIYKVTNKKTGKFYIGAHKTNNLDDGYMGSGKYLRHSINKHGIENFTKEILFVFDNADDMYAKEAELVDIDFVAESNTYNLKVGGFGYLNSKHYDNPSHSTAHSRKMTERRLEVHSANVRRSWSTEGGRKSMAMNVGIHAPGKRGNFAGRVHSESAKQKIGEKNRINQSGSGNSQFGTRWIYSQEEKKSKKISTDASLPDGWNEGRKMKF